MKMADSGDPFPRTAGTSFTDFPEDVRLSILSLLSHADLISFSCTSKLFASLLHADSKLWHALCERRWGSKTEIKRWENDKLGSKVIYKTLSKYEKLIGFWRRKGDFADADSANSSNFVLFEWTPCSIVGSRVSPSRKGDYRLARAPYLRISPTPEGEIAVLDEKGSFPTPIALKFVNKVYVFPVRLRNSNGGDFNGAGIVGNLGLGRPREPEHLKRVGWNVSWKWMYASSLSA